MQRKSVTSSNIASIGYDPELMILEIVFLKGETYQYLGVPSNVYVGIMSASSHGVYLNRHIKDVYRFSKIN